METKKRFYFQCRTCEQYKKAVSKDATICDDCDAKQRQEMRCIYHDGTQVSKANCDLCIAQNAHKRALTAMNRIARNMGL